MFENILVDNSLVEIRNRANEGEFEAMLILADHVAKGENAAHNAQHLERLMNALLDHPESSTNLHRFGNVLMVMTHLYELQYRQELCSQQEYIQNSCEMMELFLETMTAASVECWDLVKMRDCLNWIIEMKPELEHETSE